MLRRILRLVVYLAVFVVGTLLNLWAVYLASTLFWMGVERLLDG